MKNNLFSLIILSAVVASGSMLSARVVKISSAEEYHRHHKSNKPMVTMYSADWCGPCKSTKPHFHGAAQATSDMTFAIVDTGIKGLKGIAKGIRSLPTMIFSHKGRTVKREIGSRSRTQINRHVNEFRNQIRSKSAKPAPRASQKSTKPVTETTKKRVIKAPNPRPKKTHKITGPKAPAA